MKVFWSWQSDRIPRNHHYFVRDALQDACNSLVVDAEVDEGERPEVDHDTKGVAGTPDIVKAIAEKIDAAAAFVADMTPVAVTDPSTLRPDLASEKLPKPKHVQNANVMSELGYAEKAVGLDKIILVANAAHYPGPDALPFDWRNRRGPVTYNLADGADGPTRKAEQASLAAKLREPLRLILDGVSSKKAVGPVEHEASPTDPAFWIGAETGARMRDPFNQGEMLTYALPTGGRLTVRIIPAKWTAPPVAKLHERLRQNGTALYIGGQHGNTGPNKEGALAVWGPADPQGVGILARTLTQWFQDNGEMWAVDTVSFGKGSDGPFFAIKHAMPYLAAYLRNAIAAIEDFGGGPFTVEIKMIGLEGTSWPSNWMFEKIAAIRDSVSVRMKLATGSAEERRDFLMKVWNAVADAYGIPPADDVENFEKQAGLAPLNVQGAG